jgi:deferrochelatase/peroxidase EfeB
MVNTSLLHNIDENNQPILIDTDKVIDQHDPQQEDILRLLEQLQGNILKDHGRDHALHFFLRGFPKGDLGKIAKIKHDLQSLAEATYPLPNTLYSEQDFHYVASAKECYLLSRLSDADDRNYGKTYFVNVVFSWKGYDALGYSPPNEPSFAGSLKVAPARLEDENKGHIEPIPMKHWEGQYDDIDAMILVAHQDKEALIDQAGNPKIGDVKLQQLIQAFFQDNTFLEYGHVMYDKDDPDPKKKKLVEHFGFQDGISNPFFFESDRKKQEDKGITKHPLYYGGYSSAAPLELVLVPDPNCQPKEYAYGSYLVFAKLEQDVSGFHDSIKYLAARLQGEKKDEKINRAKALVIGRFPDGTPISLQKTGGGIKESDTYKTGRGVNNFGFDPTLSPNSDFQHPCPVQAHIRKANPRNLPLVEERPASERRIVRRGITYGNRKKEPKDHPTEKDLPTIGDGNGLLFMCFQANIKEQFEWVLAQWVLYFEQSDAVISDKQKDLDLPCNCWPITWKSDLSPTTQYRFGRHVVLKGGEYFFAPSIKFLQNIGKT